MPNRTKQKKRRTQNTRPRTRGSSESSSSHRSSKTPPPTGILNRLDSSTVIAVLLGIGTGTMFAGLVARLSIVFIRDQAVGGSIIAGLLLALVIGISVPRGVINWIDALAWRRFATAGKHSTVTATYIRPEPDDRPLHWVVLAVISLLGGVVAALMPMWSGMAETVYSYLDRHFLWIPAARSTLHVLLSFCVALVPLAAHGAAIASTHRLSNRRFRWSPYVTGWTMIGAGAGALLGGWLVAATHKPNLVLMVAALPSLLVALFCVSSEPSQRPKELPAEDAPEATLPTERDRWPVALRSSALVIGACFPCATLLWTVHLSVTPERAGVLVPILLTCFAVGFFRGLRTSDANPHTIGGLGVACAVSGAIMAIGMFLSAGPYLSEHYYLHLLLASVCCVSMGFASGFAHLLILPRAAKATREIGAILTKSLLIASAIAWTSGFHLAQILGSTASLAAVSLALLTLGGMLVIHEPTPSILLRRARLAGVFGCVGLMIALSPVLSSGRNSSNPGREVAKSDKTKTESSRSAQPLPERSTASDAE